MNSNLEQVCGKTVKSVKFVQQGFDWPAKLDIEFTNGSTLTAEGENYGHSNMQVFVSKSQKRP